MRRRWLAASLLVLAAVALGLSAWRYYQATRPDHRLRRGREALRQRDYDQARQVAEALQHGGYGDAAHLLRGEIYFRLAQPCLDGGRLGAAAPLLLDALAELNQVQDGEELQCEAAALAGRCYLHLNDLRQAERAFQYVLSQNPDHVDAHRGLAALYYDQGALKAAVHHLWEVARLAPEDGRPCRLLGLIFKDMDQQELAVEAYREALRRHLSPEPAREARAELAEVLAKQARFAEGLQALGTLDSPDPATVAEAKARSECLSGLGRTDDAQAVLDQALVSHPRSATLLVLRAKLHLDSGDFQAALPLLERAAEVEPHGRSVHFQLARAYAGLGRTREADEQRRLHTEIEADFAAMSRLTREADDRPWDASVRQRLAELCRKRGKPDEAAMWEQAAACCRSRGIGASMR